MSNQYFSYFKKNTEQRNIINTTDFVNGIKDKSR